MTLLNDVIESLKSFADEKRLNFGRRTYPTQMKIIGVTVPNVRLVLDYLKQTTKEFTEIEKIELAISLANSGYFEAQQLALEWLGRDKMVMKVLTKKYAQNLNNHMDNWVSVDTYANLILGPLWQRNVIGSTFLLSLAQHRDFWLRRMAVASTVALNKKTTTKTGDSDKTFLICSLVVKDHHDMVVKALSWALRSLITWDKNGVEYFLEQHKNVLHKRVIREVNHKLHTGNGLTPY